MSGLAGEGTAAVDFGSGNVIILGSMDVTTTGASGSPFGFSGNAKLGASDNSFAGTFTFTQFQHFNGTIRGKLFGPATNEIGAAWAVSAPDGRIAVGSIMGRQGAPDVSNGTFRGGLVNSETFNASEATLSFAFDNGLGFNFETGDFRDVTYSSGPFAVRYDADSGYYIYSGTGLTEIFDPATSRFLNPGPTKQVNFEMQGGLHMPGFDPDYVRSNYITVRNGDQFETHAFVFGFPTLAADLPRSGAASFNVRVEGVALDNAFRNPMDFSGRGALAVNFAAGTIGGTVPLDYQERAYASGLFRETRSGQWSYTGQLSANANAFSGNLTMTGLGDYSGSGSGKFYGPNASELGGLFNATRGPQGQALGSLRGIIDPASLPPPPGSLAALTQPTTLAAFADDRASPDGSIASISYDPADKSYAVAFDVGSATLAIGPTSADVHNSPGDAFNNFSGLISNADGSFTDWIALVNNITGTTPAVALSYMNFGRIFTVDRGLPSRGAWDYHMFAAGLQSTSMPTTGSASYAGATTGFASVYHNGAVTDYSIYSFSGTMGLNANFANGTLGATFADIAGTLFRSDNVPGNPSTRVFAGFTLDGTISGATFSGSATQGDWLRSMNGAFFGPGAPEVGGTFSSNLGNPTSAAEAIEIDGSFGAKKN